MRHLIILFLPLCLAAAWVPVAPVAADAYVPNPGKGFILYGDPVSRSLSNQTAETWAIAGGAYQRFNWSELEPNAGGFRWNIIDACLESARTHGVPFSFRVMCANAYSKTQAAASTPGWIFDAGAAFTRYPPETGARIPVWDDPVFLRELDRFHGAMAARYDGDARLAFIDLGSYGNWGENHLSYFSNVSKPLSSEDFIVKHALPFKTHFKRTPVAVASKDDDSKVVRFLDDGPSVWSNAFDRLAGAGYLLRWDGAGIGYSALRPLRHARPGTPTILEWCFNLNETLRLKNWQEKLFADVTDSGASFIGLGMWREDAPRLLAEYPEFVSELGKRLGYRLAVLSVDKKASTGAQAPTVSLRVTNRGNAPCPPPFALKLACLDRSGNVLASEPVNRIRPCEVKPGESAVWTVTPSSIPPETASIAIGLVSRPETSAPDVRFENKTSHANFWLPILLSR